MSIGSSILREFRDSYTLVLVVGLVAAGAVLVRQRGGEERRRLRMLILLACLHVVGAFAAGWARVSAPDAYPVVGFGSVVLAAAVFVGIAISLVCVGLLPRLHMPVPPILRDVIGGVLLFSSIVVLAGRAGINVSGIVATSAVITAVVGLSVQDTLGNLMAGLALQSDSSIRVGDWIRVGDISGRVVDLRWRHTSLETRNAELVILPNSQVVRSAVVVLGRTDAHPGIWRRWVFFNVDFRYPPTQVIETVSEALRVANIPRVAREPAPDCILRDFLASYAQYAARYQLTDFSADDATDSDVRACVQAALQRKRIPLAIPAEARFTTEETKERRDSKLEALLEHRADVLARTEFFRNLPAEDLAELARGMFDAPFVRGELLTRQGTEAHFLYLVESGVASVRVATSHGEREIARLVGGDVFGEMSLMTGAPRAATVLAIEDVHAYRIDKEVFQRVLQKHPNLAEHFAQLLAERKLALESATADLERAHGEKDLVESTHDLLGKIRRFFALDLEDLKK